MIAPRRANRRGALARLWPSRCEPVCGPARPARGIHGRERSEREMYFHRTRCRAYDGNTSLVQSFALARDRCRCSAVPKDRRQAVAANDSPHLCCRSGRPRKRRPRRQRRKIPAVEALTPRRLGRREGHGLRTCWSWAVQSQATDFALLRTHGGCDKQKNVGR